MKRDRHRWLTFYHHTKPKSPRPEKSLPITVPLSCDRGTLGKEKEQRPSLLKHSRHQSPKPFVSVLCRVAIIFPFRSNLSALIFLHLEIKVLQGSQAKKQSSCSELRQTQEVVKWFPQQWELLECAQDPASWLLSARYHSSRLHSQIYFSPALTYIFDIYLRRYFDLTCCFRQQHHTDDLEPQFTNS